MKYRSIIKSLAKKPYDVDGEFFSLKTPDGRLLPVQNMKHSDFVKFMEKYSSGSVRVLVMEDEDVCFVTDSRISELLTNFT